jgi:hypothetical protein
VVLLFILRRADTFQFYLNNNNSKMESKQLTAEQKKARTDRRKAKRDKDRKGAKEHFTAN